MQIICDGRKVGTGLEFVFPGLNIGKWRQGNIVTGLPWAGGHRGGRVPRYCKIAGYSTPLS